LRPLGTSPFSGGRWLFLGGSGWSDLRGEEAGVVEGGGDEVESEGAVEAGGFGGFEPEERGDDEGLKGGGPGGVRLLCVHRPAGRNHRRAVALSAG
jgi:hypothetical protein